jgi:hypothetical protein
MQFIMTPANEIIENIKKMDLSTYPHDAILEQFKKIGKAGLVLNTLHPNYEVIRVRPNQGGERFSRVDQLTYKPQEYNKTYQRGSTPNKTMFYGSSTQSDIPGANTAIGRITAVLEALPRLREADSEFSQKVTFSKWTVINNIDLATICFDKDLHQNFVDHKYVYEQFEKFLDNFPAYKERTLEINSYLAKEFSNPEPNSGSDFLYMPSAIYTEMVSEFKYEGVVYPSVRTIGLGINVAINPISADKKLVCSAVGEAIIVKKKNKEIEIVNGQSIVLKNGQKDFKFDS